MGRVDMDRVLKGAWEALNWNVDTLKSTGRVYGEDREIRESVLFLLWEAGAYTNHEIGELFAIGSSAVSHIA
ncbi:MAG: hypothetical protein DRH11_05325, partial [Deltaproteobacteria bacterium]